MSKIQEDFELLRNHCIELRQNFNTYTDLFNEENRKILSRVAATFFSDIAEIMQRDWILQACKLMDPATTKRKGIELENITIRLINKQLKTCSLLTPEIQKVTESILEFGEKIKPARHKRLAHYDREHQVKGITLGQTSEEELLNFTKDIQQYCDLVGNAIGVGPLDFSNSSCKGDVLDLLKFLHEKV
ncbi:MAG: hypothetical protein ABSE95_04575 [Thermodesulfobacteriota bacterium]|jgi:hypothetical protein